MYRYFLYVNFSSVELAKAAEERLRKVALVITVFGTITVEEHRDEVLDRTVGRLAIQLIQSFGGNAAIGCNADDLSALLLQIGKLQGQVDSMEKFRI